MDGEDLVTEIVEEDIIEDSYEEVENEASKENEETTKEENSSDEGNDKKIEVVIGDGTDLDISPAYDHIDIEKPKENKDKKEIIIPVEKKTYENKDNN